MSEQPDSLKRPSIMDYFANERTFLAWLRTGLASIGLGFVVARFGLVLKVLTGIQIPEASFDLSSVTGILLATTGGFMILLSFRRFTRNQERIKVGNYEPFSVAELVLSSVIVLIALLLIVDLILTM